MGFDQIAEEGSEAVGWVLGLARQTAKTAGSDGRRAACRVGVFR